MSQAQKDTRTPAEKARDTAGIIGSFTHEGYVPNAEDEAIHRRAERGEITTEEAIALFRERALEKERKASARRMIIGASPSRFMPGLAQHNIALLPTMGRIVTDPRTPLDERPLDRMTLGTDAAVVKYQEQRLKIEAARTVRDNRPRAELARMQTGGDDDIG